MSPPSIYLDTTIISSYWYEGSDALAWNRHLQTREWWSRERRFFRIFVSATTRDELAAGKYRRQEDCLKFVDRLKFLPVGRKVEEFSQTLLRSRLVPTTKPGDAVQMAVATVHALDYLLTWNYAHLANPVAQRQLAKICQNLQLREPIMVSPESIPRHTLGQELRRPR